MQQNFFVLLVLFSISACTPPSQLPSLVLYNGNFFTADSDGFLKHRKRPNPDRTGREIAFVECFVNHHGLKRFAMPGCANDFVTLAFEMFV